MKNRTEWGLFIGRIILGVIMTAHGIQKLMMIDQTIGMFEKIGLPPVMVYTTGIIEAVGGIALLLGIFVIPSAILLGMTMLAAILLVKIKMGLIGGAEFPLALLGLSIILAITDSRKWALSNLIQKSSKEQMN